MLVGNEAHSEEEYRARILPFSGRQWPSALLRFTVNDEMPHKLPRVLHESVAQSETVELTRTRRGTSVLPPSVPTDAPPMRKRSTSGDISEVTSRMSCCSVSEGKEEMRSLLSNFLQDFANTISSTFGDDMDPVSPATERTPKQLNKNLSRQASSISINAQPQASWNGPHPGVKCNICLRDMHGKRFRCEQCFDYDLVRTCCASVKLSFR